MSRDFFAKLRSLALTLEKEARQLERALNREDAGKRGPRLASPPARAPGLLLASPTCPGGEAASPEGGLERRSR